MVNTKELGDMAVGNAISYFISNKYEVCLPIGDKRDYDFLVEKNGEIKRVQVKFAGISSRGKCVAGLRITGGNQSFNYSRKYKKNSFDILFVYTGRGQKYVLPWSHVLCRNEISIENNKYTRYLVE